MATRTCRSALAVLLGMFIVGCGGESDRATSTTDVATTVAPPNLTQYLLQPDEVGPAEAIYRTVAAMVKLAPEP